MFDDWYCQLRRQYHNTSVIASIYFGKFIKKVNIACRYNSQGRSCLGHTCEGLELYKRHQVGPYFKTKSRTKTWRSIFLLFSSLLLLLMSLWMSVTKSDQRLLQTDPRALPTGLNQIMFQLSSCYETFPRLSLICGFFSNSRCVTACANQDCAASCVADCGFGRTNTYICSAIASTTCTTTTSSGR